MSRLSRTASAIRLAAARAVAGAQMTELTSTTHARRTEAWRPGVFSNADLTAGFSTLDNGLPCVDISINAASKQQHGDENKQGERELLLA